MIERRRNHAAWIALLLVLGAVALNVILFVGGPGERAIPWLSMLLGLAALAASAVAVKRAFGQPRIYGGKIASSIFAFLAIAICALMAFSWFQARALPSSAGAPRVGQKAPEFMLADTHGNQVSLAQLLGQGSANPPKAVLLVFYRGYW